MGCMGSRTVNPTDLSLEANMERMDAKFKQVDNNGDGQIDKAEFRKLLPSLGISWGPEELNEAMEKLDVNGDGTISSIEFKSATYMACLHNPEKKIDEILAMVIRSMVNKGPLSKAVADAAAGADGRSTLLSGMNKQEAPQRGIVKEDIESQIETKFTELDSDMDGLINLDEFAEGVNGLGLGWGMDKIKSVLSSISTSGTLNFVQFKMTLMAAAKANPNATVKDVFKITLMNLSAKLKANQAFRENKVKMMLKKVAETFDNIDANKDGKLDLKEFTAACKDTFKLTWEDDTIATVLKQIDSDGNGTIERMEFTNAFYAACVRNPEVDLADMVASVLQAMAGRGSLGGELSSGINALKKVKEPVEKRFFEEDVHSKIQQKFASMDVNRDGAINLAEFGQALSELGLEWSPGVVQAILEDVGSNGEISFNQFRGVLDAAMEANPTGSVDDVLKASLRSLKMKTQMNKQFNAVQFKKKTGQLDKEFQTRDLDKSGALDRNEFAEAVKVWGLDWTPDQVKAILQKIDTDGSGDIDLSEFKRFFSLVASKNPNMDMDEAIKVALTTMVNRGGLVQGIAAGKKLKKTKGPTISPMEEDIVSKIATKFQEMDSDGDGALNLSEFAAGLQQLGLKWPGYKIRGALRSVDKDSSGDISFSEFSQLLYPALNAFPSRDVNELLAGVLENFAEKSKMNLAFHEAQQKSMIKKVEAKFKEADKDSDGKLSSKEFSDLVASLNLNWSAEETADALKKIDSDGSGDISTKEFRSALYMACMRNPDTSIDDLIIAVLNRMQNQGSMNSQLSKGFPTLKPSKTRLKRSNSEEEAISKIESAFMRIDINKDGSLTPAELASMAADIGLGWDEAECKEIIAAIDVDGTGTLSISDFAYAVGAAAAKNKEATEDDIIKISLQSLARKRQMKMQLRDNNLKARLRQMDNLFKKLDTDKDGKLNLEEFATGIKGFNLDWSDDEIKQCLEKIDADKNGFIEKAEFQTAFYNACIKNPDMGLDDIVPAALRQMMNKGELNRAFVADFSKVSKNLRKTKPKTSTKAIGQTDVITRIEEKFQALDTNLDGVLSHAEMAKALKNLGMTWDEAKVMSLIKKMSDGSDKVRFSNFKPVMVKCANRHPDWTVDQVLRTALTNLASQSGVGAEIKKRSMVEVF